MADWTTMDWVMATSVVVLVILGITGFVVSRRRRRR